MIQHDQIAQMAKPESDQPDSMNSLQTDLSLLNEARKKLQRHDRYSAHSFLWRDMHASHVSPYGSVSLAESGQTFAPNNLAFSKVW